jgi:hypothetical protein
MVVAFISPFIGEINYVPKVITFIGEINYVPKVIKLW